MIGPLWSAQTRGEFCLDIGDFRCLANMVSGGQKSNMPFPPPLLIDEPGDETVGALQKHRRIIRRIPIVPKGGVIVRDVSLKPVERHRVFLKGSSNAGTNNVDVRRTRYQIVTSVQGFRVSIFPQQRNLQIMVGAKQELPIYTPRSNVVDLCWLPKSESPTHTLLSAGRAKKFPSFFISL